MKLKNFSTSIFLFLLFVWFFSLDSYSQKFTIETNQRKGQWKFGEHEDINSVLNSPDEIYKPRHSIATYKIDINKRTMNVVNSFYEYPGLVIEGLKISRHQNIYEIKYTDGNRPITLYLDIENETMRFMYYYEVTDSTWVQTRLNVKIS